MLFAALLACATTSPPDDSAASIVASAWDGLDVAYIEARCTPDMPGATVAYSLPDVPPVLVEAHIRTMYRSQGWVYADRAYMDALITPDMQGQALEYQCPTGNVFANDEILDVRLTVVWVSHAGA